MSATRNKEIVRRYWEGRFNERDYSVVDELLSPSARPDEQKAWLDEYHAACGDTRVTLNELIAEDDLVAVHYTFEGTFEREWLGVAPTGERSRTSGIALCRLADGKITEDEINYHGAPERVLG
jgi:predicted ester cyclase